MHSFLNLFQILLFLSSAISVYANEGLSARDLKSGDVLLQSIPCHVCALIETEEGSNYSHIGVVLRKNKQTLVLQAWNQVLALPLSRSLQFRKSGTQTLVLRPIDKIGSEVKLNSRVLSLIFNKYFNGLSYDEAFLWNNRDGFGEKLYCSEFVAKFLNYFLPEKISPKSMHFTHRRDEWIQYFRGAPPDGQEGISPGDFARSPLFKQLGYLD